MGTVAGQVELGDGANKTFVLNLYEGQVRASAGVPLRFRVMVLTQQCTMQLDI